MRNLYSSLAAATAAKQLKQTVGQASMCFAKTLLVIMVMITAAPVKLFAQLPTLSYSTPQTYTVGTAVTLAPTSSGVAGYGYSTSATTLASGFNVPMGIATDAAGNVYVADKGNMLVKKTPAGGGTPTTIGSGFTGPTGVAVDPFGNIWVTDSGDLKEVPAGGGAIITTSIGDAVAVAVDSKGNVFVLETSQGIGAITEYPVGGGPGIVISNDDNNLDTGIAVDRLGNIFVSFQAPIPDIPQVVQVTGTGGYNNLGSGLNLPTGVAVDGIGNVFVADFGSTGIVEYPVNGAPQLIVSSGLNRPNGVALDGAGNIYESDAGTNTVKEIKAVGGYFISPGLPAGLNFDENTGIISGTPTAASPATNYTVTAYNISGSGSATVNIKVVNIGLSGLALSSGILSPTFAADTTSYTAIVPAATTSITETPTSSTPSATITVNGTTVASGTASASIPLSLGANTITTVVTTAGGTGTKTYTVKVGRGSADALLTSIHLTPATTLTLVSGPSDVNYTAHVPAATSSVTVTATEQNATATITVNGTPVASGAASPSIPLSIGNNVINIVSTAQNGVSSKKYTINLARGSSDALLTSVHLTPTSPLIIVSGPSYVNYKTSVPYTTTSVTVTSTVHDATATIAVNGTTVASGVASPSIPLNVGSNVIDIVVTAQNGVSTKTYTITATRRAPSSNALLTSIRLAPATHLTIVSGPSYVNYTTTYHNSVSSCTVRAIEQDLTATITVNGTPVASGAAAPSIPLTAGSGNVINIVSTAQDGTTTKTYTITVTRNAPGSMSDLFQTVSVTKPTDNPIIENDGLVVHQGVSPNGDGIDDVFTIEGLTAYPQNKVSILDRNGAVIFLAKGYDNQLTGFDGHSNINGRMQLPGTYFYTLDYTVNGENKHKTGYIILKY